jgi:hypothetical protein
MYNTGCNFVGKEFQMRTLRILLLVLCTFILFGCLGRTGDTANDPTAAQNFLPAAPAGYTASDATSITSALTSVGGGVSAITGNPAVAAAIQRIDTLISCYRNVGAVAARVYTPTTYDITNPVIPGVGAVAVINEDRIANNFLACATSPTGDSFSAQSAEFEPCISSGSFTAGNETLYYIYAGTTPDLCNAFQTNFTR